MMASARARHNPFTQRIVGIPLWALLLAALIPALVILGLVLVYLNELIALVEDLVHYLFAPQSRAPRQVIACADSATCRIVQPIVFTALFLFTILTGFAYTTLLERKLIAWFQQRVGPNRVGPSGFMQPAADGVKLIFKEDIQPVGVYRFVYLLAPLLKVVPALIVLAVVPLGPTIDIPWFDGKWYAVPMGLIDVNVGVLWLLAITSLGTYGVILAGWASNNKYAMLGGLRACAQMISYELSLGLSIAVPVMIVGSMSMLDIVEAQRNLFDWFVFQNPLAAAVLMIALLAEVNRAPFDLPEAEQELTAGYMTEYSGMKFALFMMAEYLGMIAVSIIAISLYFGGYHFLFVDTVPILAPVVLVSKLLVLLIGMIWLRATLPRIRYDRLMHFGWKVMLPLALLAVAWSAVSLVIGGEAGADSVPVYGLASGAVFVLALVGGYWLLRRFGEATEVTVALSEAPLAQDPRVTGERNPLVAVGMGLLGIIAGIPLGLADFTLGALDRLRAAGRPREERES
ncbi:MAG: NADH-quinone oxidoreductase subunit NuoH [Chloroflexi bacterium]|nr:NADH-quinone oxidoreductase subunit NuoH [Chloroflexota bacterium]